MKHSRPTRSSSNAANGVSSPRTLAVCLLALLCAATLADAQVRPADAQTRPQPPRQQSEKQKDSPFEEERDESESESKSKEEVVRPRATDPATVMRTAHFIRVHSDSVFVNEREVEDSLRKRKEFQAWGMVLTRNDAEADLVIEISRKAFTRRFTFIVLDPRTMEIVTSGKTRSVLFGKHIPTKIAEKFANRVKVVRPYPPVEASKP